MGKDKQGEGKRTPTLPADSEGTRAQIPGENVQQAPTPAYDLNLVTDVRPPNDPVRLLRGPMPEEADLGLVRGDRRERLVGRYVDRQQEVDDQARGNPPAEADRRQMQAELEAQVSQEDQKMQELEARLSRTDSPIQEPSAAESGPADQISQQEPSVPLDSQPSDPNNLAPPANQEAQTNQQAQTGPMEAQEEPRQAQTVQHNPGTQPSVPNTPAFSEASSKDTWGHSRHTTPGSSRKKEKEG